MKFKIFSQSIIGSVICNIILAYIMFMLARLIFFFVNYSMFAPYINWDLFTSMTWGSFKFDTTAIIYINAIYILLVLFPFHGKEKPKYYAITKLFYVISNALALMANLGDSVYFQYTGRRTTATVFSEFSNEGNIFSIIMREFVNHWYLVLIFIILVIGIWIMYRTPKPRYRVTLFTYYATLILALIITIPLCVIGIRGGVGHAVRPITISNANQYVNRPVEAALVLNTPFSIIRTIGKKAFETPHYMSDAEMERTFSPVHKPIQGKTFAPKNVVVIIIESFGKEYSAWLNRDIDSVNYKGYMPFLDGLMKNSLTYQYSYGNGRKSIDGMPSVLSGIPMFVEPFFLTPASLNKVSSIAGELDKKGYYTAFFHGAPNGSMGFEAFARSVGFKDYYGMTEYENKPGGYNSADYDGTWAIWDDPFMQFYADKMNSFKQPFMTTIFTASSHHPFVIPDQYKSRFPEGNLPIQKCVSYTDMALRNFFVKASHQKWFKNTLFVITADHTNQTARPEYESDLGLFSIPIIFYAPGDTTLAAYRVKSIAQQIDIMPTVLGYLGYDHPYISFGKDLINTAAHNTYAVNYNNGIYQYVKGDYVLQFDGKQTKAIYNYKTDRLMKHNLLGRIHQQVIMEHELKAIIQQYMQRMNTDRLTVK